MKVLGKSIGENFSAEVGKVFLNMSQNPKAIKDL